MLDELRNLLYRLTQAFSPKKRGPVQKSVSGRTKSILLTDGHTQGAQQPVLLLPSAEDEQAAAKRIAAEYKPSNTVMVDDKPAKPTVMYQTKKANPELIKYVDKPLKPLARESNGGEVIKYSDKKGGEVIKYKVAASTPASMANVPGKTSGDVIKYTPTRIEIKSGEPMPMDKWQSSKM